MDDERPTILNATSESEVGETVIVTRVRIPAPLARRLQSLLAEDKFGFTSLEHLIVSGLKSFAGFKERQLEALRHDAEVRR